MLKCTIRFIRDSRTISGDDVLSIREDEENADLYTLAFRPADLKKTYHEFHLDRERSVDYISDVLKTLPYDSDPFVHVQVETAMHPAVLYRVADLYNVPLRHLIEDVVNTALRRPVDRVRIRSRA